MRVSTVLLLALLTAAGSCKREAPATTPEPAPAATETRAEPAPEPLTTEAPEGHAHGHHHHGHDKHRPFENAADYIAFLDRADRAAWQKPDAVVAALGLRGDEILADVGAGSGYFTFRFARALPRGRVLAIDVDPEMVRHIHHTAMTDGLANVEAVLTKPDDPGVPATAGVVFICDVLHHVPQPAAWLAKIFGAVRPGTRLAIVEFKEGDLPQGPPAAIKIAREKVIALADGAGFRFVKEPAGFLPYQHLLLFEKP